MLKPCCWDFLEPKYHVLKVKGRAMCHLSMDEIFCTLPTLLCASPINHMKYFNNGGGLWNEWPLTGGHNIFNKSIKIYLWSQFYYEMNGFLLKDIIFMTKCEDLFKKLILPFSSFISYKPSCLACPFSYAIWISLYNSLIVWFSLKCTTKFKNDTQWWIIV